MDRAKDNYIFFILKNELINITSYLFTFFIDNVNNTLCLNLTDLLKWHAG